MNNETPGPLTAEEHRARKDVDAAPQAIAFLREAFRDDGAEGESVHLICRVVEWLLATVKARDEENARLRAQPEEPVVCPPAPTIDELLAITDAPAPMEDRLREAVGLALDMRNRWCRIAVDLGWPIGSTPSNPRAALAGQLAAIRAIVSARPDESAEAAVKRALVEQRRKTEADIISDLGAILLSSRGTPLSAYKEIIAYIEALAHPERSRERLE